MLVDRGSLYTHGASDLTDADLLKVGTRLDPRAQCSGDGLSRRRDRLICRLRARGDSFGAWPELILNACRSATARCRRDSGDGPH